MTPSRESPATKCGCGLEGLHASTIEREPTSMFESYIHEMRFRERLARVVVYGVVQLSKGGQ